MNLSLNRNYMLAHLTKFENQHEIVSTSFSDNSHGDSRPRAIIALAICSRRYESHPPPKQMKFRTIDRCEIPWNACLLSCLMHFDEWKRNFLWEIASNQTTDGIPWIFPFVFFLLTFGCRDITETNIGRLRFVFICLTDWFWSYGCCFWSHCFDLHWNQLQKIKINSFHWPMMMDFGETIFAYTKE